MASELTAALYESSNDCYGRARKRRVTAGVGAVNQKQGTQFVSTCNRCGAEVVWLKSGRTGRSYLVNVFRGQRDQRYYVGTSFHRARCDQTVADRERASSDYDAGYRTGLVWDEAMAACRRGDVAAMEALTATGDVPNGYASAAWQDGFRAAKDDLAKAA